MIKWTATDKIRAEELMDIYNSILEWHVSTRDAWIDYVEQD